MISGIILYSVAIVLTIASFFKDRGRTKKALLKSFNLFKNILPDVLSIMFFVGLSLAILTPELISSLIGESSGSLGILLSTVVGSVAIVPSFVVFPLGSTLVQNGAGLPQVAAFMSSLMAVGFVTLPMESKLFGRKFAYLRNASGAVMSVIFAYIIWGVMI